MSENEKEKIANFGVDIDDEDRRVVRVYCADEVLSIRFSTEEDARKADTLSTKMMEIVCDLWQRGAKLLDAATWPSGERPSGEPPAPKGSDEP